MARDSDTNLIARRSDAALSRSDHRSTLSASKILTQLGWGEADHLVSVEIGTRIAKAIPHARFESVRSSGFAAVGATTFMHENSTRSTEMFGASSRFLVTATLASSRGWIKKALIIQAEAKFRG